MIKKLNIYSLYLFLISILFFKVPSFYIIPFLKNSFFTSQALSRVIILVIFCFQLVKHILYKKKFFNDKDSNRAVFLIIIFVFLQSLSVINAINTISFLNRYKDIIISFIAFFDFFFYKKYYKQIITVFLISFFINIFYQSIILFFQDFFIKYL